MGLYIVLVPLKEKALIARIRAVAGRRSSVAVGIGDDSAVLRIPPGHQALVTTDFTVEGVHFRPEWHSPEVVGRRCLTRGLSDIAAMGGIPVAAFLSLALPRTARQAQVDRFLRGVLDTAAQFAITLAGGDIAESPSGMITDIVVVGSVPKGRAILRSGARPGDRIYVTGALGGSAAALSELFAGRRIPPAGYPRHFAPEARVKIGQFLREKRLASAMIDLSDGLSTDLAHICDESGVGAELVQAAIPLATVGKGQGSKVDLQHALHGGEDYELLFTAPSKKRVPARILGVPVTLIGQVRRKKGVWLKDQNGRRVVLSPQGWEHFRRSIVSRRVTS